MLRNMILSLALFGLVMGCGKKTETRKDEAPKAEAKPAAKPAAVPEAKPTEAKPTEAKPTEAKPTEAKPATTTDGKPTEEKPAAPTAEPATTEKKDPNAGTGHFGGKFTLTENTKLSAVLARAEDHKEKNVRVEARVSKVCRKKGCWMVLQSDANDGKTVRVRMKDYGFFVPKDCDGKQAVVEGVFSVKEVSEPARKHLAEDGGEDPTKITGKAVEFTLMASAIDILPAK